MLKYLSSIGMDGVPGKRLLFQKLMTSTFRRPDERRVSGEFVRCYKYCGEGFGVYAKGRKDGKPESWGVFARSGGKARISEARRAVFPGGELVICRAGSNLTPVEFRLENECAANPTDGETAALSFFALYGKVLLPVYKDDETRAFRAEREQARRELIRRAAQGDKASEIMMNESVVEAARDVWWRLKTSDVFTVFESYCMSLGKRSAVYSILSEITAADRLTNRFSGAAVYKLALDMGGLSVTAFVGQTALMGEPSAGMRLLATGMLQGAVHRAAFEPPGIRRF
jgi:hypothetical protein